VDLAQRQDHRHASYLLNNFEFPMVDVATRAGYASRASSWVLGANYQLNDISAVYASCTTARARGSSPDDYRRGTVGYTRDLDADDRLLAEVSFGTSTMTWTAAWTTGTSWRAWNWRTGSRLLGSIANVPPAEPFEHCLRLPAERSGSLLRIVEVGEHWSRRRAPPPGVRCANSDAAPRGLSPDSAQ